MKYFICSIVIGICLCSCAGQVVDDLPSKNSSVDTQLDIETVMAGFDSEQNTLGVYPFYYDLNRVEATPWRDADYASGIVIQGNLVPTALERRQPSVTNRLPRTWLQIPTELEGLAAYTYAVGYLSEIVVTAEQSGLVYVLVAEHVLTPQFVLEFLDKGARLTNIRIRVNDTSDRYSVWQVNVEGSLLLPTLNDVHNAVVLVPREEIKTPLFSEQLTDYKLNSDKTLEFQYPIRRGWLSSRFGYRNNPFTGKLEYHRGIDIAAKGEESAKSSAKGFVVASGLAGGHGNRVEIFHDETFTTTYSHLGNIDVKTGQTLEACSELGILSPTTGRSTGPHLGFQILKEDKAVDPQKYASPTNACS